MPTTDTFSLLLAGLVVGQALMAMAVLPFTRAGRRARLMLFAFLIALILFEAFPLVVAVSPQAATAYLVATLPAFLTLAPAFWLYLRAITARSQQQPGVAEVIGHGFPALLALGVVGTATTLGGVDGPLASGDFDIDGWNAESIVGLGLGVIAALIWPAQLLFYGVLSVRLILRHRKALRDHFAALDARELRWVDLLGVLLIVYLAQALLLNVAGLASPVWAERWDGLATLVLVSIIVVFALRQPQVFGPGDETGTTADKTGPSTPTERYAKSGLGVERSRQIADALHDVMQTKKLYEDPLLSLPRLAKAVQSPPEYVTQTLNDTLQESFFDYVNRWRIEAACRRLTEGSESITRIAFDVGYNSRSAFYRAFKTQTGVTPSAYRSSSQLSPPMTGGAEITDLDEARARKRPG